MTERRYLEAFRQRTEPDDESLDRVRRGWRARRGPAPHKRPLLLFAGFAVAGALAVGIALRAPPALEARLSSATATSAAITPLIRADYQGVGAVSGDADAPRFLWSEGTIQLDVAPDRGLSLVVETEEMHVAVIGTVFSVTRDARGSRVQVERGQVVATCLHEPDGRPGRLGAGEGFTCLPGDSEGLLRRATALRDAEEAPEEILATVERALAMPDVDPLIRVELAFLRLTLLTQLGRYTDATGAAEAFLADDPPLHRTEVETVRERLRAAGF